MEHISHLLPEPSAMLTHGTIEKYLTSCPAHLRCTGLIAFKVLADQYRSVAGAARHFGLGPFRQRRNPTAEFFDQLVIRPQCPEVAAGSSQVGNQVVSAHNRFEIMRINRRCRNPGSDPDEIRNWQR